MSIRILLCLASLVTTCFAQSGTTAIAHVQESDRATPHLSRLWVLSCISLMAGTGADMASSWGRYESNPLLRSSDGRFGAKGVSIKLLAAGVTLVPQICLRRHQHTQRLFTVINFAQAGLYTGAAIHNMGVPRRPGE